MMLRGVLFSAAFAICISISCVTGQENITLSPSGSAIATPGENFTLMCNSSVGAEENNTYVWLRNGSIELCSLNCTTMPRNVTALLDDDSFIMMLFAGMGELLNLSNVNASTHGGVYDCVALTSEGEFVESVTLYVRPLIVEHPEDMEVENGDNVTLRCRAESFPYPTYHWQKYNAITNQFYNISGEENSTLELTVLYSDYGVYRCVATAPIINEVAYSNNATLSVSPRGSAMVTPVNITVNHGESANFSCSAMGGPNNMFIWLKNGSEVICSNCSDNPMPLNLTAINLSDVVVGMTEEYMDSMINATEDGGNYECVVINDAGFGIARSIIYVTPLIVEHPEDMRVENGDNVTLRCRAESFPYPTYHWQKYNTTTNQYHDISGEENSTLELTVSYSDYGVYRCVATAPIINEVAYSNNATLSVSPQNSLFTRNTEANAEVGQSVNLTCAAQGGPLLTFTWIRMGFDIQTSTVDLISTPTVASSVLMISNVTSSDQGMYQCQVNNSAGMGSINLILNVSPKGNVAVSDANRTVTTGENVVINCTAEGGPGNVFQWFRNGTERLCFNCSSLPNGTVTDVEEIVNNTADLLLPIGHVLNLTSINATEDGGTYECVVVNDAGFGIARSTIYVSPLIVEHPEDMRVENNDNVTLRCHAESFPYPTYRWQKYNTSTNQYYDISEENSTLELTVSYNDYGVYRCVATAPIINEAAYSNNATLSVSPRGSAMITPVNITVNHGESANFSCSAMGGPNNMFIWLKNGSDVICSNCSDNPMPLNLTAINLSDVIVGMTEEYMVFMINATEDGGSYECVVMNDAGFDVAVTNLYVRPIIVKHPQNVEFTSGEQINLSCQAESFPYPEYRWRMLNTHTNLQFEDIRSQINSDLMLNASHLNFGIYLCCANAPVINEEACSDNATVTVSPEGSVSTLNREANTEVGQSVNLTCTSQGGPLLTFTWRRMSSNIQTSTIDLLSSTTITAQSVLMISNVTASDQGIYQCQVNNSAGMGSINLIINVSPKGNVAVSDTNRTVSTGDNVIINCTAEGGPDNVFQWFRNGTQRLCFNCSSLPNGTVTDVEEIVNNTADLLLPIGHVLNLTSVNATEDGGTYECLVFNDAGFGVARSIIYVSPLIVEHPEDVRVENGDNVTLRCRAESFPYPTYQWQKYNNTVNRYYDISGEENSTLELTVLYSDNGVYRCVATAPIINEIAYSNNATLSVSPKGSVMVTPVNITVNYGESANFSCYAMGGPSNMILWLKNISQVVCFDCSQVSAMPPNITDILSNISLTERVSSMSTALDLSNISATDDGGNYDCIVLNDAGFGVQSATLYVNIRIIEQPMSQQGVMGDNVTLTCRAESYPFPTYQWEKFNHTSQLFEPLSGENNTNLVLTNMARSDFGLYRCSVSAPIINNQVNSSVAELTFAPSIVENPVFINVTKIEDDIILTCSAVSFPPSTITWGHNDTTVSNGERVMITTTMPYFFQVTSTLNVSTSMTNDTGNYSCTATSPLGMFQPATSEDVLVLVQDIPEQPHSLMASNITSRSLTLTWIEPHDNNAPINGYNITFTEPDFLLGQNITVNVDGAIELANIRELHPGVTYYFTVVAYNDIGVSKSSNPLPARTLEERPFPPDMFTTEANPTSVVIEWKEIPPAKRLGIIQNYTINGQIVGFRNTRSRRSVNESIIISRELQACLNNTGKKETFTLTVPAIYRNVTIDNLVPYADYIYTVAAATSAGAGNHSMTQSVSTTVQRPDAITHLEVFEFELTNLVVAWDPPICPNGPISAYTVYYKVSNTSQVNVIISDETYHQIAATSTDRFITISSLMRQSNYTVHVRATVTYNGTDLLGVADTELGVTLISDVQTNVTLPVTIIVNGTEVPAFLPQDITYRVPLPPVEAFGPPDRVRFMAVFKAEIDGNEMIDFGERYSNLTEPCEVTRDKPEGCIAAGFNPNLGDTVSSSFEFGDGSMTTALLTQFNRRRQMGSQVQFVNTPMKPLTTYCLFSMGNVDTGVGNITVTRFVRIACPTRTTFSRVGLGVGLGLVLLLMILACCVCILVILICCCLRRRTRKEKYDVAETEMTTKKIVPTDEKRSENIYSIVGTQEVMIQDFPARVKKMHENNDYLYSTEFSGIEPEHSPTTNAAQLEVNKTKNRYTQVAAYDHSRVQLQSFIDELGSDYINANFVDGYKKPKAYIATQGPLPDTVTDFWRMVWENNSTLIVMLTNLEEKGKMKCYQYWPAQDEVEEHGSFEVKLDQEKIKGSFITRNFIIKKIGGTDQMRVTQLHYTDWSNYGSIPEKMEPYIDFVESILNTSDMQSPITVHCSAGVGRTGAFITMCTQMKRINAKEKVDVYNYVRYLRKQRCMMVQTEAEYIFIHDALVQYIEKLGIPYRDSETEPPKYAAEMGLEMETTT